MRSLEPSPFSGTANPIRGSPSCGLSSTCEPAGIRVDRVMLFEGLREVEIIQDCHCEAKMTQCVRAPALKTYYSETPYETVVDVGKCVGIKGAPGKNLISKISFNFHVNNPFKLTIIITHTGHKKYLSENS